KGHGAGGYPAADGGSYVCQQGNGIVGGNAIGARLQRGCRGIGADVEGERGRYAGEITAVAAVGGSDGVRAHLSEGGGAGGDRVGVECGGAERLRAVQEDDAAGGSSISFGGHDGCGEGYVAAGGDRGGAGAELGGRGGDGRRDSEAERRRCAGIV